MNKSARRRARHACVGSLLYSGRVIRRADCRFRARATSLGSKAANASRTTTPCSGFTAVSPTLCSSLLWCADAFGAGGCWFTCARPFLARLRTAALPQTADATCIILIDLQRHAAYRYLLVLVLPVALPATVTPVFGYNILREPSAAAAGTHIPWRRDVARVFVRKKNGYITLRCAAGDAATALDERGSSAAKYFSVAYAASAS